MWLRTVHPIAVPPVVTVEVVPRTALVEKTVGKKAFQPTRRRNEGSYEYTSEPYYILTKLV